MAKKAYKNNKNQFDRIDQKIERKRRLDRKNSYFSEGTAFYETATLRKIKGIDIDNFEQFFSDNDVV